MLKRHIIRATVLSLLIVAMPAVFSCDTSSQMDPYVFIDVYLDPVAHPVDDSHLLTVFLYIDNTWTAYYLAPTFNTNLVFLPPLHTGEYPLYFEISYDIDGSGAADSGDWYFGWYNKTIRPPDPTALPLDPLIRPDMEFMYVSINMEDNHGIFP